jgi:uncharacterized protein YneR
MGKTAVFFFCITYSIGSLLPKGALAHETNSYTVGTCLVRGGVRLSIGGLRSFFARYGGSSTIQDSFSMGFTKEEPDNIGLSTEVNGITFYIVEDEIWYLDGKDMLVDYRKDRDEIVYLYA